MPPYLPIKDSKGGTCKEVAKQIGKTMLYPKNKLNLFTKG